MVSELNFRCGVMGSFLGREGYEQPLVFFWWFFLLIFFFVFWFGEEIIGTEQKEEVLMVICGETPLEGEGHVETPWDSLCRMVLWKLLNTCGWIFGACLLLRLKSWSARGASHHPAFICNCRTVSQTFYSPIYPVDERNGGVDLE